jgi:hypothetical protein
MATFFKVVIAMSTIAHLLNGLHQALELLEKCQQNSMMPSLLPPNFKNTQILELMNSRILCKSEHIFLPRPRVFILGGAMGGAHDFKFFLHTCQFFVSNVFRVFLWKCSKFIMQGHILNLIGDSNMCKILKLKCHDTHIFHQNESIVLRLHGSKDNKCLVYNGNIGPR